MQALSAQKFREQQDVERRRHLEEMRSREAEKLSAVFERRKAIDAAATDRKEAMLKRAQVSCSLVGMGARFLKTGYPVFKWSKIQVLYKNRFLG